LAAGLVAAAPLLGAGCNCGPDLGNIVEGTKGAASDALREGGEMVDKAKSGMSETSCALALDSNMDKTEAKMRLNNLVDLLKKSENSLNIIGDKMISECKTTLNSSNFEKSGDDPTASGVVEESGKVRYNMDLEFAKMGGAGNHELVNGPLYVDTEADGTGNLETGMEYKIANNEFVTISIEGDFNNSNSADPVILGVIHRNGNETLKYELKLNYTFDKNEPIPFQIGQFYVYEGNNDEICHRSLDKLGPNDIPKELTSIITGILSGKNKLVETLTRTNYCTYR
jgi:hypothetical protein